MQEEPSSRADRCHPPPPRVLRTSVAAGILQEVTEMSAAQADHLPGRFDDAHVLPDNLGALRLTARWHNERTMMTRVHAPHGMVA